MSTEAIMQNFWFTQWCVSQCQRGGSAAETDGWIDGLVVLVVLAVFIALLIWFVWDSSRPIDLVQDYKKQSTQNSRSKTRPTEDARPVSPGSMGALGITGTALWIAGLCKSGTSNIFTSPEQKKGEVK